MVSLVFVGLNIIGFVRNSLEKLKFDDFPCFYLAACCVVNGKANDVYPIPLENLKHHPGFADSSVMKNAYSQFASDINMENPPRFIYPLPLMLLIWPLGLFEINVSIWIFRLVLMACVSISAIFVSEIMFIQRKKYDYWNIILILGLSWSPLAWATIRVANTSAISGLFISMAVWALMAEKKKIAGLAIAIAMIIKFSSLPLLVYLVIIGKWWTVIYTIIFGLLLTLASIAIFGITAFTDFIAILPLLGFVNHESISLPSFLVVTYGPVAYDLLGNYIKMISFLAIISTCVISNIILRRCADESIKTNQLVLMAILYFWLFIFSTCTHYHYYVYFFPFVPSLLLISNKSITFKIISMIIIMAMTVPLSTEPRFAQFILSPIRYFFSNQEMKAYINTLIEGLIVWHMLLAAIIGFVFLLAFIFIREMITKASRI